MPPCPCRYASGVAPTRSKVFERASRVGPVARNSQQFGESVVGYNQLTVRIELGEAFRGAGDGVQKLHPCFGQFFQQIIIGDTRLDHLDERGIDATCHRKQHEHEENGHRRHHQIQRIADHDVSDCQSGSTQPTVNPTDPAGMVASTMAPPAPMAAMVSPMIACSGEAVAGISQAAPVPHRKP